MTMRDDLRRLAWDCVWLSVLAAVFSLAYILLSLAIHGYVRW